MAKSEGISVDTKLDIPEKLPGIDSTELACVFSNAIENARNACRKMPDGTEKILKITCVTKPVLGFEIANSYCQDVEFDKKGLPVSQQKGHGIGTQSIAAFAKKYGAVLDYQAQDGIFKLRIIMNE